MDIKQAIEHVIKCNPDDSKTSEHSSAFKFFGRKSHLDISIFFDEDLFENVLFYYVYIHDMGYPPIYFFNCRPETLLLKYLEHNFIPELIEAYKLVSK